MPEGLPIARGKDINIILPRMANRHGLIAGATGTGKTVTLRVIARCRVTAIVRSCRFYGRLAWKIQH